MKIKLQQGLLEYFDRIITLNSEVIGTYQPRHKGFYQFELNGKYHTTTRLGMSIIDILNGDILNGDGSDRDGLTNEQIIQED
jgi:hypothetical protein